MKFTVIATTAILSSVVVGTAWDCEVYCDKDGEANNDDALEIIKDVRGQQNCCLNTKPGQMIPPLTEHGTAKGYYSGEGSECANVQNTDCGKFADTLEKIRSKCVNTGTNKVSGLCTGGSGSGKWSAVLSGT